ncbi:AraC family transcriptional regulator [Terrimonas pollutisoli]|uniref:AraC family transcriptional regulator n=1 Tax=Terrimonas pollutisoli TaxID=3034147 RepID=UPI0023ED6BC1|nr:AraC family transcriptional regulator [Terrimonas sp. H1YJ31]
MKTIPIRSIKATQKEPVFSGSFSIRDLGDLLGGKDMVQELHRHDFFFLLVLKKGTGSHEIDFTPYKVCDNAVFLMRPGQVHQLTLQAGTTGYLVEFKPDFYSPHDKSSLQLLRRAGNRNFYQPDDDSLRKILAALTSIFREYSGKQESYQQVIKANLDILFIELVRQHHKGPPNNVNPYTQERLDELLALLETHIADYKQVSQYAARLNLTPYQLNAITKATLGKTCSALIDEHIILEAKRYLLATTNQVNQIADHLGYEDVSYFIRFFKKQTGYSPESFRHNFR